MKHNYVSSIKKWTVALATGLLLTSGAAMAKKGVTTPDGFESVLILMGTGTIDKHNPEPHPGVINCDGLICDGEFFQKEIMGRTDAEIAEVAQQAKTFYLERFGLAADDLVANNRATFKSFTLNPDFEYRLQIATGMKAKGEGWIIRDGGFNLTITDPQGVPMAGEMAGRLAKPDDQFLFGSYNILVTNKKGKPKKELVIDYRSRVPAVSDEDGFRLQSFLSSEEFGEGLVLGTILTRDGADETIKVNGRTVISFPAETQLDSFPAFPAFDDKPKSK